MGIEDKYLKEEKDWSRIHPDVWDKTIDDALDFLNYYLLVNKSNIESFEHADRTSRREQDEVRRNRNMIPQLQKTINEIENFIELRKKQDKERNFRW